MSASENIDERVFAIVVHLRACDFRDVTREARQREITHGQMGADRVIDRSLQRLRKAGRIECSGKPRKWRIKSEAAK